MLTDTAIRNAKPGEKPYKVADSQSLYLLVNPRGSSFWHFKYRINGVERKSPSDDSSGPHSYRLAKGATSSPASAAPAHPAPTKKVAAGPAASHTSPAMMLAASSARPVMRLNIP